MRVEEEESCLGCWFHIGFGPHRSLGEFGSRRDVPDFSEVVMRLVGDLWCRTG